MGKRKVTGSPAHFQVGEIWEGPSGTHWRVTHVTSDDMAYLRAESTSMRTLIRSHYVPDNWARIKAAEGANGTTA